MTQVPLGQALIKFPNIRLAKPEFPKTSLDLDTITSDLEFLRKLSQDSRIQFFQDQSTTSGDLITVMPDTGSTFYFLGCVVQNTDTVAGTFRIDNDGTTREVVELQAGETYEFKIPIDRLVGSMSNTFVLVAETANTSSQSSLFGWNEKTKKIQ